MTHEELKRWYDAEMEDVKKYMQAACIEHGEHAEVLHEIAKQELEHAAMLQSMM